MYTSLPHAPDLKINCKIFSYVAMPYYLYINPGNSFPLMRYTQCIHDISACVYHLHSRPSAISITNVMAVL